MNKLWVLLIGLVLVAGTAWAAESKTAEQAATTLKGVLVDNACASGHQETLGEFVKTHTKECALMPNCEASGYSLYTSDGQLYAFTAESNSKIAKFLKTKKGTLHVTVKVQKNGTDLKLILIKNQG